MLRAEARPGHFTASRILLLPELRYSLLRVPYGAPHSGTKGKTDAGYECDRENTTSQKPWKSEAQSSLTVALGPHPRGQTKVLGVTHLETTKQILILLPSCHRESHAAPLEQEENPQGTLKAPGSLRGPLEFLGLSLLTKYH